jgi:hypothetical protein
VQVDPIKPTFKPPGTERLTLKYDELLSSFAFNFNLRRYTLDDDQDSDDDGAHRRGGGGRGTGGGGRGAYARPLLSS